jgi:transcriptional regulator with XRE-family HTH domain
MENALDTLVRQLRMQKGYSLRELARRIGLSPNFLSSIKDKAQREQLRGHFDRIPNACLVDVKGRFYAAQIPDLSRFQ